MENYLPILKTKLSIPALNGSSIKRQRLIDKLNVGSSFKLVLISAPAGFGKTLLLSEWAKETDKPVAWISLDEEDNDPVRFWSYFIASLQTINEKLGTAAQASLNSAHYQPQEVFLTILINEITDRLPICNIILDDYHNKITDN